MEMSLPSPPLPVTAAVPPPLFGVKEDKKARMTANWWGRRAGMEWPGEHARKVKTSWKWRSSGVSCLRVVAVTPAHSQFAIHLNAKRQK
eukprot:1155072-Pelagomonas_calceolata.AAC.2